jgi:hypothetical protein
MATTDFDKGEGLGLRSPCGRLVPTLFVCLRRQHCFVASLFVRLGRQHRLVTMLFVAFRCQHCLMATAFLNECKGRGRRRPCGSLVTTLFVGRLCSLG